LKPKQQPIQLPVENQEPIAGSSDASAQSAVAPSSAGHVPHHNTSLRFDLGLARVSLLIDFISYMSLAVAPTGFIYLIAGVLSSFGGGFGPAVQSIALELYARSSGTGAAAAGTLFGALSVLTALVGQVCPIAHHLLQPAHRPHRSLDPRSTAWSTSALCGFSQR
jgi:hypothetical protein